MSLEPVVVLFVPALLVALVVGIAGWLGGDRANLDQLRTARDILDGRYARGEIELEEYLKLRRDLLGADHKQSAAAVVSRKQVWKKRSTSATCFITINNASLQEI